MSPSLPRIPVFDGHNDTLLKLEIESRSGEERSFFERSGKGHLDLPRAREAGFAGGLFAMFVPSNLDQDFTKPFNPSDPANYGEIGQPEALAFTLALVARAQRLERESQGQVAICRDATAIETAIEKNQLAISLHIEGAEAIDTNFHSLEALHAAGLRSLGPVWSRKNAFAEGTPMAFPSSPDTGPGLTSAGVELVHACNQLGILIDLSHITEKGFWDVAKTTFRPLVASHSNAHAICANARNLTDQQLDAIKESKGLVGVNFHVGFLREDGRHSSNTPLDTIVRHITYLVERLGEDHVGLGSDFDGCMLPAPMKDVTGLQPLIEKLASSGFDEPLIKKISFRNWLTVLKHTQN